MNYKKFEEQPLESVFENPPSEFRGAPFWAWNCDITEPQVLKQLDYLKEMGFGGAHIHVRTGMSMEYLGKEYFSAVKACAEKAKNDNSLIYLYDEDRWPSGAAGGIITKNHEYRAKYLAFSTIIQDEILLCTYDVSLNEEGYLKEYKVINKDDLAKGQKWYAYLKYETESPWFNNQTYVDTLSKEAIDAFIDVTYNSYKEAVGEYFGTTINSMFTDEPQFSRKEMFKFASDTKDVKIPWTTDFEDTYKQAYGDSILEHLPELFWELHELSVSKYRYQYHDHVAERFAIAFADNCGKWCDENGISLTGHMNMEDCLYDQSISIGDCMRSYRGFGFAGIDLLCDQVQLSTAKQAQSASHQYGHGGVLSELYGVTNWDFDFRGHKFQGDWQAALGITLRVHHLSWVSMEGEAKRDYPASMNYQSPWYKEYSYVEDHFARVNTAMTRGKAVVKIGVIHPIESYWLYFGSNQHTGAIREQIEENFSMLNQWLLFGLMDFDYICESLLPTQCNKIGEKLSVGEMEYDVILVPNNIGLRKSTVEILEKFVNNGGKVIFSGNKPKYINGEESNLCDEVYKKSVNIPYDKVSILNSLENIRQIDIRDKNGARTNNLIYSLRKFNDKKYIFIAHAKKNNRQDYPELEPISIILNGEFKVTLLDTINGKVKDVETNYNLGKTVINLEIYSHDSILLELLDGKKVTNILAEKSVENERIFYSKDMDYTLEEENVMLLDVAKYALDEGKWRKPEEILRLDNILRKEMSWPLKEEYFAQPWAVEKEIISHSLTLRFTINSDILVKESFLGIEQAEKAEIKLNGAEVPSNICGYFVDECIKKVKLPTINIGENILEIKIPFGKTTNTEWCYLLGDFGVKIKGSESILVEKPKKINFGDLVTQGFPFYGGNITYHINVEEKIKNPTIKVAHYKGSLIKVDIGNNETNKIVYPPYVTKFEENCNGKINIKLFGNRYNSFGALHNATPNSWSGPNGWRTFGDEWSEEYIFRGFGIMSEALVYGEK